MNVDIKNSASHRRRTKIIATLGPGTDDPKVLAGLIRAGVDVFRVNMSHGSPEEQERRALMVREIAGQLRWQVAILFDLQGPKIRIESFEGGSVQLVGGDHFMLDAEDPDTPGDDKRVGVSYSNLPNDVEPGDTLLFDDGLISMQVQSVSGQRVHCLVENGGTLSNRKGLNLKGGGLSVSGLAQHDYPSLELAARLGADFLAVSFVSNADDIRQARSLLRKAGSKAAVVAKIERMEALDNLDEICEASDVIMVARGDLGVEIGEAELPGLQKRIIRTALKVIEAMNRICLGAERHFEAEGDVRHLNVRYERIDQAIAMAAMFMATNVSVQAIVALTESGSTAQWLSRVQSSVPIYAFSTNSVSRRKMAMFRDVFPVKQESASENADEVISEALSTLLAHGAVREDDRIILTMGDRMSKSGGTNTMRFIKLDEEGRARYGI